MCCDPSYWEELLTQPGAAPVRPFVQDVSLDALYGDSARDRMSYHELTVIDAPGYKWPHSDYHMLMQSHVDGKLHPS
jgi:hypothetical protein